MNAKFASAVDPIFLLTIESLDRLDQGEHVNATALRDEFLQRFETADAILGEEPNWKLAKYALASWIDEVLVQHAWDGSKWWSNNVLEAKMFNTRLCSVRFFEQARNAAALPERDAIEVFYHCVILGFRGMYGSSGEAAQAAESMHLPASLSAWLKATDRMILHGEPLSNRQPTLRAISGAPPNWSRRRVLATSLVLALLVTINVIIARA